MRLGVFHHLPTPYVTDMGPKKKQDHVTQFFVYIYCNHTVHI